ncbi:MAG: helix-turn-helix domain-containing protein [Bacteroidales bacterium]|nr:helix-turn-helix domain-containing protein [Bacteroidales bacterium]
MIDLGKVLTTEDKLIASTMQKMEKSSKWLSSFLVKYRPPMNGERYMTDKEASEYLRLSRRSLQEYRNKRMVPFIILGGKVLYPESAIYELLEANYFKAIP